MNERRLFFATLRHPALRVLRAALMHLTWEHGIAWQDLTMLAIDIAPGGWPWVLTTDHHVLLCCRPDEDHPDFLVCRI
jgi:hypothetical protein